MLFYLQFKNHDIEKLQDLIKFFFDKVQSSNPTSFSSKILFPQWYSDPPVHRMTVLEKLLKEFLTFDDATKNRIIDAFNRSLDIKRLFDDTTLSIDTAKDFNNIVWKTINDKKGNTKQLSIADFLSELFNHLYSSQLGKKDSSFCKKIKSDLGEFYRLFVQENSINYVEYMVCPYCGLEKMRDEMSIRKPDHDHLLPKGNDLFVFAAINSKNLFPSGTDCNLVKDTKQLLYSDDFKTRCTAFYPYNSQPHPFEEMVFSLNCLELPNINNSYKGNWSVEIEPKNAADTIIRDKIESWDRVFNIKARYKRIISIGNKALIDKELQLTRLTNTEELKKKLESQIERLPINYFMLSTELEVITRRIFFQWAIEEISYLQELIDLNIKNNFATQVDLSFVA
ncbi:hypothetical protein [Flavobacterium sp.]|uniref:hypothetical protein n=1 Tax=Flavobacterium sp. TaxID=239 RepID=UPI0026327840|nr:hypothetical protein [Flavobacterium sp.]